LHGLQRLLLEPLHENDPYPKKVFRNSRPEDFTEPERVMHISLSQDNGKKRGDIAGDVSTIMRKCGFAGS